MRGLALGYRLVFLDQCVRIRERREAIARSYGMLAQLADQLGLHRLREILAENLPKQGVYFFSTMVSEPNSRPPSPVSYGSERMASPQARWQHCETGCELTSAHAPAPGIIAPPFSDFMSDAQSSSAIICKNAILIGVTDIGVSFRMRPRRYRHPRFLALTMLVPLGLVRRVTSSNPSSVSQSRCSCSV